MVHPRARHSSDKCTVRRKETTQIIHEHSTATQLCIEGVPTKYCSTLSVNGSPPWCFSEHQNHYPSRPHVPRSQLPSQNPHRQVTSDQSTFTVSVRSSLRPLTPFQPPPSPKKKKGSSFCSQDVCRPASHASPQLNSTPHHSHRRFWAVAMVLSHVFSLGMAIDPVHHRFAVTPDFQYQFLVFCGPLEYQRLQVSWFLLLGTPSVVFFLAHTMKGDHVSRQV